MKQLFKLIDGKFDFSDSLVVEDDVEVEGYALPDASKHYKEDGSEMTQEEINAIRNAPSAPSIDDRLRAAEDAITFLLFS